MKIFLVYLIIFISSSTHAKSLVLESVLVNCPKSESCTQRRQRLQTLLGEYRSPVHLKNTLRVMASDGGYQSFSYSINIIDNKFVLKIDLKLKPTIVEINIGFIDRNIDFNPHHLLSIKEGDFFEAQRLKDNAESFKKRLESMGFPHNSHTFQVIEKNEKVTIGIAITLGKPRLFKKVKTDGKSKFITSYLSKKFLSLYNKPYDVTKFKIVLDEAQRELFSYGYYLVNLDFSPEFYRDRVTAVIKISNEQLYAFDFKNLREEHRDVIHSLVIDMFRKYKKPLTENAIKTALREHYATKARLKADFDVETSESKNKYDEIVMVYHVKMDENYKTRIKDVRFIGNRHFSNRRLREMYKSEAFELASINYYDQEFYSFFLDYLKTQYIEDGFVQIQVQGPNADFENDKKEAEIEYIIQEGPRAIIRGVTFEDLPVEFEGKLLEIITNNTGKPFNPIAMVDDIRKVASQLQELGYYYAEVANANDKELVKYSKTGADVDIHFKIKTGPLVQLNRVLYLGNDKTKKTVLAKKVSLKQGDLITPSRARDIEAAISATGLFNSVSVAPVKHHSKSTSTDLLVKVVERDYGLIEFAPGYRTDLGLKLTSTASYTNIRGMNRTVTLRSQLNQRLDYETLDPVRRAEAVPLLEHNTSIAYNQGDIFNSMIDLGMSAGYQFKRFYPFDAEIFRTNATLTKDLSRKLSSSFRYQLEEINQTNASNERDNGSFRIGAVTPSLTYDLRNSQVNPLSGAFFNISTEFANPYLLSQKEPDLTIDYYKLISRNRFYIPFKNGTLALSLVGGVQENLATDPLRDSNGTPQVDENGQALTEGYIPSIKVFRLTGMDIVRGFSDEEINRLPNGDDISEARVQNRAYLINLKVEPRYFINDSLMAGVFYDAGRVFVNQVNLGELRDSVGLSFKILTPVGTLDFDYGIKLLRERNKNGSLESPGRFHVSIGFF